MGQVSNATCRLQFYFVSRKITYLNLPLFRFLLQLVDQFKYSTS